jgi:hypothetical protein
LLVEATIFELGDEFPKRLDIRVVLPNTTALPEALSLALHPPYPPVEWREGEGWL